MPLDLDDSANAEGAPESGFTKIPNEFLEALGRTRIPGEARMILDVIIRKIYGFGKKQDAIPLSQFELATGLTRNHVCRALKHLTDNRLISPNKGTGNTTTYRINNNYSQWQVVPKKRRPNIGSPQIGNQAVPILGHSKERFSKERIKPSCPQKKFSDEVVRLSTLFADLIISNNPKHTGLANGKREATIRSWSDPIDKLIRIDGQTSEDIEQVIRWSQSDPFWSGNILSGSTLRKQYDKLATKALRTGFVPAASQVARNQAEGEGWDEETLRMCSR